MPALLTSDGSARHFMILESPFDMPLRLEVPSSTTILLMIIIPLIFIVIVVLWYTPIYWAWLLLVVIVNMAVAYYFVSLHYWQTLRSSILEINQDEKGQWSVLTKATGWQLVTLLPTSFLSTFLIVLNFKGDKHRYSVILPAGCLDDDTFRRLRVRIKVAFS